MSYYISPLSFFGVLALLVVKHMPCFPNGAVESACQCGRCNRHEFHPWVGKIPCSETATRSNILAWKIPWTEEPGSYSPWGRRVRQD